jgi:hypothetical protein
MSVRCYLAPSSLLTQPNSIQSNSKVLNCLMMNAPGGPKKADDTDHPLTEVMMNFTVNQIRWV